MADLNPKSIREAIACAADQVEQPMFARAFRLLESPVADLALAARLAVEEMDRALDIDGAPEMEMATFAARQFATMAKQLKDFWLEHHNAACDAVYAAGSDPEQAAEHELHQAIRVWLECPADKRPSPEALGERIVEIAVSAAK
jgi:non-ribosomal peptide synthetase component F